MIITTLTACSIALTAYDALAVAYVTAAAIEGAPEIASALDADVPTVTEADLWRAAAIANQECRK